MVNFTTWKYQMKIKNRDLAKLLELSPASISAKVNGETAFSLAEANKIRIHYKMDDRTFIWAFLEEPIRV